MAKGGKVKLKATISPKKAQKGNKVTWKSSNKKIATVNAKGVVKAKAKKGTATITAKAGKKNGCLIEGMACPGGCVAGAGTNIAVPTATKDLLNFKNASDKKLPEADVRQPE